MALKQIETKSKLIKRFCQFLFLNVFLAVMMLTGALSHAASPDDTAIGELILEDLKAKEGSKSFFLSMNCYEKNVSNGCSRYDYYYGDEGCKCSADEDFAEFIEIKPKVKFSVADDAPSGIRLLGDFKKGKYQITVKKGAMSRSRSAIKESMTYNVTVPAMQPRVRFASSGRYLSRKDWKKLGISSVNNKKINLRVSHIREDNLVAWLRGSEDGEIADFVGEKTITVDSKEDEAKELAVDLASIIKVPQKGIYEVEVAGVVEKKPSIVDQFRFWGDDEDTEAPNEESKGDKRYLVVTELNILAKWQPLERKYQVSVLDLNSGSPLNSVNVKAVSFTGKILDECQTTQHGCSLAVDHEAFALLASKDADLTYLRFSDLKLETNGEYIYGEPYSGASPYRAAVYADRDIYRPGEKVHVVTVLRNTKYVAPPIGMPVSVKFYDPRGRQTRVVNLKLGSAGVIETFLELDSTAETGGYLAQVEVGKKVIGGLKFQVEEFVPERIRLSGVFNQESFDAKDSPEVQLNAKYLFGGTPSGAAYKAFCELEASDFRPSKNSDFFYGVWKDEERSNKPIALGSYEGVLDDNGSASVECPKASANVRYAGMMNIVARTSVMEAGSGRATHKTFRAAVHPEAFYLGLKSSKSKLKSGDTSKIKGVIVNVQGNVLKVNPKIEVLTYALKTDYNWSYDRSSGEYGYKRTVHQQLMSREKVSTSNGRFEFSFKASEVAPSYMVRVQSGNARTDLVIEGSGSGWSSRYSYEYSSSKTPAPGKATQLKLLTGKEIHVGKEHDVKVVFPHQGWALFTVETDRVLVSEWKKIKEAGSFEWSFSVKEFYPNVYVSAFFVKDPHLESKESFLPERSYGVVSLPMRPEDFIAALKIDAPEEVRPGSKLTVDLVLESQDKESYVTLAAVDEGILQLTGYQSPNPLQQIFSNRALGVQTYETIGWNLLLPSTVFSSKTGGDDEGVVQAAPSTGPRPVKPVALWSGLVKIGPSGKARVSFDVPVFRGELRLMAVSIGNARIATATGKVRVSEPIVIQSTGPRFLSKDDEAHIPVMLTNTTDMVRKVEIVIKSENFDFGDGSLSGSPEPAVSILGDSRFNIKLPKKSSASVKFRVKALQAYGGARLKVVAQSGQDETFDEMEFPLQSHGVKSRLRMVIPLADEFKSVDYPIFETGTDSTTVMLTANPWSAAVVDLLPQLMRYPYGCIEQTTSTLRPLVYLPEIVRDLDPKIADAAKINKYVYSGIQRILSMQTSSGGFGYWPGAQEPHFFGTLFATHVLLDAQKAGYEIPQKRIKDALLYLSNNYVNKYSRRDPARAFDMDYYGYDQEPYLIYVLAKGGAGADKRARVEALLNHLKSENKQFAFESKYLLEAALYISGDRKYVAQLKNPLVPAEFASVSPWSSGSTRIGGDWVRTGFYSDFKAMALILNIHADLFPGDAGSNKLAEAVAAGFGRQNWSYNTQELGWGVTGLGKISAATSFEDYKPELRIGDRINIQRVAVSGGRDWIWRLRNPSRLALNFSSGGKALPRNSYLVVTSEGVEFSQSNEIDVLSAISNKTDINSIIEKDSAAVQKAIDRAAAGIPYESPASEKNTDSDVSVSNGLAIEREYFDMEGSKIDFSQPVALGQLIVARIRVTNLSGNYLRNIALTERLPGGLEVENPRLGRDVSLSWFDKNELWKFDHLDVRDNRVSFFGDLSKSESREVVVAMRATLAGVFRAPASDVECMYDARVVARTSGIRVTISQDKK